ncbi:hypothetical protein D3C71_1673500 [compost metagenome]
MTMYPELLESPAIDLAKWKTPDVFPSWPCNSRGIHTLCGFSSSCLNHEDSLKLSIKALSFVPAEEIGKPSFIGIRYTASTPFDAVSQSFSCALIWLDSTLRSSLLVVGLFPCLSAF